MATFLKTILAGLNGYKTYAATILAIATGIGLILAKDYAPGITDILQALLVVFAGTSVVSLRHAVEKSRVPVVGPQPK